MPWRLVGFIIFLGMLLGFIGFNQKNICDISFGFTVIPGVPIYLTVFASFVLGMLCSLPLVISSRLKKKQAPVSKRGDRGGGQAQKAVGKGKKGRRGSAQGRRAVRRGRKL